MPNLRRLWWRFKRFFTDTRTVVVLRGLTCPQRLALEDMLATWVQLGHLGGSRWTAFYADGDGDFRPRIRVNGRNAKKCELLRKEDLWHDGEYRIDFDWIAWRLHKEAPDA